MYKRKTKSGGLGIVRTISKTQQNVADKSENVNPNKTSQIQLPSKIITKTQQNVVDKFENTNPNKALQIQSSSRTPSKVDLNKSDDEIHSDPEPSPKRSRRFVTNDSSSIMKDLSFSTLQETRDNKTPSKLHKVKPKVVPSNKLNEIEINNSTQQNKKAFAKPSLCAPSDNNSIQKKVKKNPVYNKKDTYLEELFEEAGLTLSDGTSPNVLMIRGTDVIWASNLELLELIFFSKRASSAKRCAAGRHRAIDEDHARCLPAAQRFALLALLEKKINSSSSKFETQITSVPLITNR
ncbi:hypothetical protein J6590_001231 [Homalodisca vitripennis]|nr:hypothetical protein J6590_001231 [Homalodisca vitripennis]